MENVTPLSAELLDLLRSTDTCTISNAIEDFQVRMRNDGYIQNGVNCLFPNLPPVAGYAVTGRIRTGSPPITGLCYYQRNDWWEYLSRFPSPTIIVAADVDHSPGTGAFFGELHAEIAAALGCVAYISNGSVRDLDALRRNRFQCFASHPTVSHAYAHIVEFGEPVEIGTLKICPGDILHGDQHGVLSIPREVLGRLPDAVAEVRRREAELIRLCRSPGFTLDKLTRMLEKGTVCPSDDRT